MEKPLDFPHQTLLHQHSSPSFVNQVLLGSHSPFEELELVPDSINLPISTEYTLLRNLKVLKLCGIKFETDFCRTVWLTFPLLTKFESKNCAWFFQASYVYVSAPLLETIFIQHDIDMPYYYYDKNYPRSRINFCCSASKLKEFSYCSFLPQEVSLPSLCHASAKIILHEICESYDMRDFKVFELLSLFGNAKVYQIRVSSGKCSVYPF
jgi:hypothetical protein